MEYIFVQSYNKVFIIITLLILQFVIQPSSCFSSTNTKRLHFNVKWTTVTRLCNTKQMLTVNGKFPGPTITVHEGENIEIKVTNRIADKNTTIHWHGIRQYRSGWADGPAYVTQCPIRGGETYTYKFKVDNQRGTLFWHAHHSWQRATVHGAFIIYPRFPYPYFPPHFEHQVPIILGEWWNKDVEELELEMMSSGAGPKDSDAYTINGLPGPLYPCSTKDTFIQTVKPGKTYLLRIINAALTAELFFAITNHTLTVVEIDAVYIKPFKTTTIMIAPGQTTNVLLTADQIPDSTGLFPIVARPYVTNIFPFDNSMPMGFLSYNKQEVFLDPLNFTAMASNIPNLPQIGDTLFATRFSNSLRSLGSPQYPCNVPKSIDRRDVITIGLNLANCPANQTCKGLDGKKFRASMNNQSFVLPSRAILESHYNKLLTKEVDLDFPKNPQNPFDYTEAAPLTKNMNPEFGSKVLELPYDTSLEIVLQGTSFLSNENHPMHVHGHNFFIIGSGFGNFDVEKDPQTYNLVDPPERNTVAVPTGGWAAIRLRTDNPGVWFIHCHLEEHTSWGLAMVFIVDDGPEPSQKLPPPPKDLPLC